SAGDVNGDGFDDVIVGAPGYSGSAEEEGAAFLWYGSSTDPKRPAGSMSNFDWMVTGGQAHARFGFSVASAGDVNGDGYADVIIGAPQYSNGQEREGRAFLYLGSKDGLARSPAWTAESDQIGAQLGWSVASAGDFNGDGFSDVLVGAPFFDESAT